MADETKNPNEQKPPALQPPKDIEELLKELPKVSGPVSQTSPPPPRPAMPQAPRPPLPSAMPPASPINKPPTPTPKPPSSTTQVPPPASQTGDFKSLIRTMEQDLEAAKKGLKPESKPFEIKPPPPPTPKPLAPQEGAKPFIPQARLGPLEKTKSLEIPKIIPAPRVIPAPPVKGPALGLTKPRFSISPKFLIIILGIAVVFAGAWWLLTKEDEVVVAPTPTQTPTPTPIAKTIFELIPGIQTIAIPATEKNFLTIFLNTLNNKDDTSFFTKGEFLTLIIYENFQSGNQYSLSQIFQKFGIVPPSGVLENLDSNEWAIVTYGQQETFDSKGLPSFNAEPKLKLGLIAKTTNPESLRSALNTWELTMANDLKNLFGLDLKKATSETFLDNIYTGAEIRYQNFPFADNSIDYAILSLSEFGTDYFILTNSRESIYSAINLLNNQ